MPVLSLALLAAACGQASGPQAGQEESAVDVVWNEVLRADDDLWYELDSIAGSEYGEIMIAATAKDVGGDRDVITNELVVWRLSEQGEVLAQFDLKKPTHDAAGEEIDSRLSEGLAVHLLRSGNALAVAGFAAGRPWLLELDTAGEVLVSRELLAPARRGLITRIVGMGDDGFLLLGREGPASLALRLDARYDIEWQVKNEREAGSSSFVSAAHAGGQLTVAENSGSYSVLGTGESSVIVSHYGVDSGTPLAEHPLPGRHGSLAYSGDDTVLVLFDRSAAMDRDIRLTALDRSLGEKWTRPVVRLESAGPWMSRFSLLAAAEGRSFAVGSKEGRPLVAALSSEGEVLWTSWRQDMDPSTKYEAVRSSTGSLLVASAVYVEVDGVLRKKIRCFAMEVSDEDE